MCEGFVEFEDSSLSIAVKTIQTELKVCENEYIYVFYLAHVVDFLLTTILLLLLLLTELMFFLNGYMTIFVDVYILVQTIQHQHSLDRLYFQQILSTIEYDDV